MMNKNRQSCVSACVPQVRPCSWIADHSHYIGVDDRSCAWPIDNSLGWLLINEENYVSNVCMVFRMSIDYSTYSWALCEIHFDCRVLLHHRQHIPHRERRHHLKWRNSPHSLTSRWTSQGVLGGGTANGTLSGVSPYYERSDALIKTHSNMEHSRDPGDRI